MADAVEDAVLELVEATREWHGPPKGAARGRRGAAVEAMLDEAFGLVHALGSKKAGVRRRRTRREEESRRPSPGQACVRLVVRAAKARLAPGARGEERERERAREKQHEAGACTAGGQASANVAEVRQGGASAPGVRASAARAFEWRSGCSTGSCEVRARSRCAGEAADDEVRAQIWSQSRLCAL